MGLQCESADISTELPRFARQSKILKADHRERKLKLQRGKKTRETNSERALTARVRPNGRATRTALSLAALTFPLTSENGVRK